MIIFVFAILIDSLEVLQKFSSRLMEYCSSDGEEASRTRSSAKTGDVIIIVFARALLNLSCCLLGTGLSHL